MSTDDADMADCEGDKVVTMMDVLQEQQDFEEDANAVLGASDDKNCTYPKGYIKRQAIYACLTCCSDAKMDPTKRAGVCLACSLSCHENHELIELYTKRNFRCDCGNPKFNFHPCQFTPNKTDLCEDNIYNQNFSGLYCICKRPYPDPDAAEEDEMIQCIICEDWLHSAHLEATVPANDLYSEMICKGCMEKNEFLHDYSEFAVNTENINVDITVNSTGQSEADVIIDSHMLNGEEGVNGEKETETEVAPNSQKTSNEIAHDDSNEDKTNESATEADNAKDTVNESDKPDSETSSKISSKEPQNDESKIENTDNLTESTDKFTSVSEPKGNGEGEKLKNAAINESESKTDEKENADNPTESPDKLNSESAPMESSGDEETKNKASNESESENEKMETEENADKLTKSSDKPTSELTANDIGQDEISAEEKIEGNLLDEKSEIQDTSSKNTDATKEVNEEAEKSPIPDISNELSAADSEKEQSKLNTEPLDSNTAVAASSDPSEETDENAEKEVTENTSPKENDELGDEKEKPEQNETEITDTKEDASKDTNDVDMTDFTDTVATDNVTCNGGSTNENKRKLSTEESTDNLSIKKVKLEETNKCVRPRGVKKIFKGATFWGSNFRQKLCTCNECISMYKDLSVLFLIDPEDTVSAYENLGMEKINGAPSQYEKGLEALSSLGRIQQINALTEYNKMRDKLLDFLKSFKDKKEVVKEEDIKAFFAGMKPKREPDGVYFCR